MTNNNWLTPHEIAKSLKVGDETVYRWIRTQKLVAYEVGGLYRIKQSDLDNFIHEKRQGGDNSEVTRDSTGKQR